MDFKLSLDQNFLLAEHQQAASHRAEVQPEHVCTAFLNYNYGVSGSEGLYKPPLFKSVRHRREVGPAGPLKTTWWIQMLATNPVGTPQCPFQ